MDEKVLFVADCHRKTHSMSALCSRFGISREAGYELLRRYQAEGPAGLLPRDNEQRPHEALHQRTPGSCYAASPRPLPSALPEIAYPKHFELRYVSRNGGIRWRRHWVNISHVLDQEVVGFEPVADTLWDVWFGPVWLGRFNEHTGQLDLLHKKEGRVKP